MASELHAFGCNNGFSANRSYIRIARTLWLQGATSGRGEQCESTPMHKFLTEMKACNEQCTERRSTVMKRHENHRGPF